MASAEGSTEGLFCVAEYFGGDGANVGVSPIWPRSKVGKCARRPTLQLKVSYTYSVVGDKF